MGLLAGASPSPFRTARVSTGAVPASGSVTVVVPLDQVPSSDFTVVAAVEHGGAGNTLGVQKVTALSAGSVSVRVGNSDALTAHTGTLHVVAVLG